MPCAQSCWPIAKKGIRSLETDAFRHAFTIGLQALAAFEGQERWSDYTTKKMHATPVAGDADRVAKIFAKARARALAFGFDNERVEKNALPFHLMDLWNNGVGVDAAWRYLELNGFDVGALSNDGFADFVSGMIKSQPERFILEPTTDPRALDPSRFNEDLLPPDNWTFTEAAGAVYRGRKTSLRELLRDAFPHRYAGEDEAPGAPPTPDGGREPYPAPLSEGGPATPRAAPKTEKASPKSQTLKQRFGLAPDADDGAAERRKPANAHDLDGTPVGVVARVGGRDGVFNLRADTPIKRGGKATTIRRHMEDKGFWLDPAVGGFRRDGDREIDFHWFDWADADDPFEQKLTLEAPVKWPWPKKTFGRRAAR